MVQRVMLAARRRRRSRPSTPTTASSWTSATAATQLDIARCPTASWPSGPSPTTSSKYRRVLDHFDAVQASASPRRPRCTRQSRSSASRCSCTRTREAVIDGFLVDHEPPICVIDDPLSAGGHPLGLAAGCRGPGLQHRRAPSSTSYHVPDDIDIEVEGFNKPGRHREHFNRVVCAAGEADRPGPASARRSIFAVRPTAHADMVVAC
jgi:type I restriction enzyme R subunit